MGGFDLACAAIEAFTRSLAEEVGGQGVRVVAVRPNFTPETNPGVPEEALQPLVKDTLLRRLPRRWRKWPARRSSPPRRRGVR
jgi:3-oxoacyl-[acyl-carrier protein] reductase